MHAQLQVAAVVCFYMTAALIMIFTNKIVLTTAPSLPVLFMLAQSTMTVLLLHLTSFASSKIRIPTIERKSAVKLMPLIVVDAMGFVFSALCLRDVEAAFFQIARGLVLPLTILVSSMHTRSAPTFPVLGCALIVTAGFFLGVNPISNASLPTHAVPTPLALFYGFLSALAIATHAVLIKSSLPVVEGSVTALAYWQNAGSMVLLALLALVKGEVGDFMVWDGDWHTLLWGNVVTGIVGFMISVAGILSVKVTSPITHMFSSAARSVLQVALGVRIFGDILTSQRAASVGTILLGTLLYTWAKHREMERKEETAKREHGIDLEAQQQPLRPSEDDDVVFDAGDDDGKHNEKHVA